MRNIESLDFSKKHFIQVEFNFGVLRAGRIILSLKRQGKDFTKYSNFEKYNVKFVDYVEALANLDKIENYKNFENYQWNIIFTITYNVVVSTLYF